MRRRPGEVRDAIVGVLEGRGRGASVNEITAEVIELIGDVAPSSIRSYLRLNTPALFAKMDRAQYALAGFDAAPIKEPDATPSAAIFRFGKATLHHDECLDWLDRQQPCSFQPTSGSWTRPSGPRCGALARRDDAAGSCPRGGATPPALRSAAQSGA